MPPDISALEIGTPCWATHSSPPLLTEHDTRLRVHQPHPDGVLERDAVAVEHPRGGQVHPELGGLQRPVDHVALHATHGSDRAAHRASLDGDQGVEEDQRRLARRAHAVCDDRAPVDALPGDPGRRVVDVLEERDEFLRGIVDGLQSVVEGVFEHLPSAPRGESAEHLHDSVHLRITDPEMVFGAGHDSAGVGEPILHVDPAVQQSMTGRCPVRVERRSRGRCRSQRAPQHRIDRGVGGGRWSEGVEVIFEDGHGVSAPEPRRSVPRTRPRIPAGAP
ncbi:hypothetical protein [Gordonia sp. C13]|uniref:hypothetical protein n=1 Tax=Gordonia sp. C13 TaxID=2935078 RepID=UPI00200B0329|nr:hypothetical protein [Gordonia sp. C13]MCK8614557.1 hypothetical protein [Gordonia sp. C13]